MSTVTTSSSGSRPDAAPQQDPGLSRLIGERYPVYAQADITVDSLDAPPDETVERVVQGLESHGALR